VAYRKRSQNWVKYARAKLLIDPKSHQNKASDRYLRDITGLPPEEYEDPVPDEMLDRYLLSRNRKRGYLF